MVSLDDHPPAKEKHYRSLFLPLPNAELEDPFTALLAYLPDPVSLSSYMSTLRKNMNAHPSALLGEVGLDRVVRVPLFFPAPGHPSGDPLQLTPFSIPLAHQLAVLEAQLGLAVELGRAVSMHSVKAQAVTKELIERMRERYGERWLRISVDLHSCGMSAETCRDIQVCRFPGEWTRLTCGMSGFRNNTRIYICRCQQQSILARQHTASSSLPAILCVCLPSRISITSISVHRGHGK